MVRCSSELLVVLGEWNGAVKGTEKLVMKVQDFGNGLLRRWTGKSKSRGRVVMAEEREVGLRR